MWSNFISVPTAGQLGWDHFGNSVKYKCTYFQEAFLQSPASYSQTFYSWHSQSPKNIWVMCNSLKKLSWNPELSAKQQVIQCRNNREGMQS